MRDHHHANAKNVDCQFFQWPNNLQGEGRRRGKQRGMEGKFALKWDEEMEIILKKIDFNGLRFGLCGLGYPSFFNILECQH